MKKTSFFALLTVVIFGGVSCSKTPDSPNDHTPPAAATPPVNTNTTTTNYSVSTIAATGVTQQLGPSGAQYKLSASDGTGISSVSILFPGTTPPAEGIYTITPGATTGLLCNFILNKTGSGPASTGTLSINSLGSSTVAVFTGISCTVSNSSGTNTYTVTGAIKY